MAGGKGMTSLLLIRVGHGFWESKMTLGKRYMVYYLSFRFRLKVSEKLPTYPFPKSTLTLTSHLRQNVGLGEG